MLKEKIEEKQAAAIRDHTSQVSYDSGILGMDPTK